MGKIWRAIQELLAVLGIIERVRTIAEVVAVIALIGVFIRQWAVNLDLVQLILLLVLATCIGIICATYIAQWRRKRSIRYIPKLLSRMTQRIRYLIEAAKIPEQGKMEDFFRDIGEILNIDVEQLEEVANLNNPAQTRKTLADMVSQATELMQSQPNNLIIFLISLAATMDNHDIGLASIKDEKYYALEKQLEILKDRVQNTNKMQKLNNYILWSQGLNSLLLLNHHQSKRSIPPEIIPAKAKAFMAYLEPIIIETLMSSLFASVREEFLGGDKNRQ